MVPGDTLLHFDPAIGRTVPCRVKAIRSTGIQEITAVTTEIGTTFRASTFHPVMTRHGRTELLLADELQYVPREHYTSDPLEALARLVGHNMGDGTVTRRPRPMEGGELRPRLQAAWYSMHAGDLDRLALDLKIAGLRSEPALVGCKKSKPGKPDTYQVQASGEVARRLVEAGCPVGKKKHQAFDVPAWIRNGTPGIKREFLAALFGAEGNMPTQASGRAKRCNQPSLSMWKEREEDGIAFFDCLASMLEELGIEANTRRKHHPKGWAFQIWVRSGIANIKRFYDEVGYRYIRQMEVRAFQWSAYFGAYLHEARDRKVRVQVMRGSGMTYRQIGAALGCRAGVAYQLCTTPERQPARTFPRFADWLAPRWKDGALFAAIIDRRQEGPQPVVNIAVDSPDHSYLLADGLNNFNCSFEDTIDAVFAAEDIRATTPPTAGTCRRRTSSRRCRSCCRRDG